MEVESRERANENSTKRISSSWEKNEPKSHGSVATVGGEMDTSYARNCPKKDSATLSTFSSPISNGDVVFCQRSRPAVRRTDP